MCIRDSAGSYIDSASMESRMTICNMAIEAGAKVGLIAVDQTTLNYVRDHSGMSQQDYEQAQNFWTTLHSDEDAVFNKKIIFILCIMTLKYFTV